MQVYNAGLYGPALLEHWILRCPLRGHRLPPSATSIKLLHRTTNEVKVVYFAISTIRSHVAITQQFAAASLKYMLQPEQSPGHSNSSDLSHGYIILESNYASIE